MKPTELIIALMTLPSCLFAQDQTTALQIVIENQMQAFEARDLSRAFSYASPTIQQLFKEPKNFGKMVENGYPMVWNNTKIDFLKAYRSGPMVVQRVIVTDKNGYSNLLDYYMVPTSEGWRIDGVSLVPASDLSA